MEVGIGIDITGDGFLGESIPFTPADLETLELWLDPSDISTLWQDAGQTQPVTSDADPVGAILDKSANAIVLTTAVTAQKPSYAIGAAGINTVPVLHFDGGDVLRDSVSGRPSALYQLGADHSIYSVISAESVAAGIRGIVGQTFSTRSWVLGHDDNGMRHDPGESLALSATGVTLQDRDTILHAEFDNGADLSLRYIDGSHLESLAANIDPLPVSAGDRLAIGAIASSSSAAWYFLGKFAETIVTSSVSASDRNKIVSYFKSKYGIA